jgi:hypothetical protein
MCSLQVGPKNEKPTRHSTFWRWVPYERGFDLAQLPGRQKTVIRVPDVDIEPIGILVIWLKVVMPLTTITATGGAWYLSFRLEQSKKPDEAEQCDYCTR